MTCRTKLVRLPVVLSLIAIMLLSATVRTACLCVDGQVKLICGELFEQTVLGSFGEIQHVDCCCEACAAALVAESEAALSDQQVEKRRCHPIQVAIDLRPHEAKDPLKVISPHLPAIDQDESTTGRCLASLLDTSRDWGGSASTPSRTHVNLRI